MIRKVLGAASDVMIVCFVAAMCAGLAGCRGSGSGSSPVPDGGGGPAGGHGAGQPPANSPPVAVAASDVTSGEVPLEVAFSAEESSDPDGGVASCSWSFGDGSADAAGTTVEHTFTVAGDFTVTLTVTDDLGAASTAAIPVSIAPLACPVFGAGAAAGTLESSAILEASGIAASRRNPGIYWINNDSGDTARVFAVDDAGRNLGVYSFSGAGAQDWEDIAVGPGPEADVSYIYAADIGDNAYARPYVSVYRVPEPAVAIDQSPVTVSLAGAVRLDMSYPGGANDAESLMVDPVNGDIYIVLKRSDGASKVLRNPAPHSSGATVTMEEVAALQFGAGSLPGSTLATGADISSNGSYVVIRTYSNAFIWLRPFGQPLADAFAGDPCPVTLRGEPQGEAIGFSADGRSLFTVSEGSHPPLYRYDR